MRELEETSRTLWLRAQDSTLSIDRPLFGQHAPSAYLDPSSPPPTPAEIDEAFEVVVATGEALGFAEFGSDQLARFGRRLAHRLSSPMLPRIQRARDAWREGRDEVVTRHTTNWLGVTRVEAPDTDLGVRITACFGSPAVIADVRQALSGLWGAMPYQSRDQLLGVGSAVLATIARAMLEASIEDESRLDELLAGADLLDGTGADERDAAIASLDTAFGHFDAEEFADLVPASTPATDSPFDDRLLDRQLAPFSTTADSVVKQLVELGASLRAFEVVQTRTDALASIVVELTTVRGTSSAAIARGNAWTHDLLTVSEGFGLVLRRPTPPQARMLAEFLGGFANATTLRSGVAGLAGVLRAPSGNEVWQTRLALVQRAALAQKHLPTTWSRVPGLDAGTGAPPVTARRSAAIRLRGTASLQVQGRAWLVGVPRLPGLSRRDRVRRETSLRLLARGHARWLRVDIPRGSSRVAIAVAVGSPTPRPLDPVGRPIPPVVFGRRYSKYRGTQLLPLYPVADRLCLSENGEYPVEGEAHDVLIDALARTCERLLSQIIQGPGTGDAPLGGGADALAPRPVTIDG